MLSEKTDMSYTVAGNIATVIPTVMQ